MTDICTPLSQTGVGPPIYILRTLEKVHSPDRPSVEQARHVLLQFLRRLAGSSMGTAVSGHILVFRIVCNWPILETALTPLRHIDPIPDYPSGHTPYGSGFSFAPLEGP